MAGTLVTQVLGPVGSSGMNTQSSPIDLPAEFATLAVNCYADEAGRATARASVQLVTDASVDLGSNPVARCYRHNLANGTSEQYLAGGGLILWSDGTTLTDTGVGPYGADNWQFASLNGKVFAAQEGVTFVYFNETTHVGTNIATPSQPTAIHSAYGRLWAVKGSTLYWSDLLDGTNFTTGASGSLDLQRVHSTFRDTAVAVVAFNGQIIVLGRHSIYVLTLAADKNPNNTVAPIFLSDTIPNIGCAARDSVVSTGDDVLYLSDDGIRSLSRSLQEKQGPAPLTDISQMNKDYLITNLVKGSTLSNVTAAWHPEKAWYMVFAPDTNEAWVFDFGRRIPNSTLPRTFLWRFVDAKVIRCGLWWTDSTMQYGGIGGMYDMETYNAAEEYTMTVTGGWLTMGGPERMDQYKRVMLNLTGGSGQTAFLRWAVDFNPNSLRTLTFTLDSESTVYEFNVAEFSLAEFSAGQATVELYLNIGGNGKVIQFTVEFPIQGNPITLNNAIAFFKQGRIR